MKRGTAAKVILGKDTLMDVPAGIVHGTDVILGGKAGLLNDFGGLVLSNNLMLGKKVSRGTITTVTVRGVAPITLPDAIAGSLQAVKAFGGTEQRNIPDNYIQRDYIYIISGAYLLTGIVPTYDYKIEMDFGTTTVSASKTVLGGRTETYGGMELIIASSTNFVVDAFGTGSADRYSSSVTAQNNTRYKFTYANQVATLESGGSTLFTNTMTGTAANGAALCINGNNDNGRVTASSVGEIYLYSFKVWNDQGELVADYVPAVEKGTVPVVGFYDTVSKTFKTATAGTIAAGSETVPTPDGPMDIVSNNGVLKYSANIANVNAQTALVGYYISASGVVTADSSNWIYQDYIPVSPNTTYTLTMSQSVYYVFISEYSTASDSGFVIRKAGNTGTNTSLTITTGATTNFVRFGANLDRNVVTLAKVLAINWQLNKGNSMPYTPYVEDGIYADGTVETITVHRKNLFNPNVQPVAIGPYLGVPLNQYTTGNYWLSMTRKQGADVPSGALGVVFKRNDSASTGARWFVNNGEENSSFMPKGSPLNFVSTDDVSYIRLAVYPSNVATWATFMNAYNIQIEQGTRRTEYEPYFNGGTATAEMLLKVGDYQDVQSILDGVVTRNVGVKVLDGTGGWESTSTSGLWLLRNVVATVLPSTCICTHFLGVSTTTSGLNMPDLSIRYGVTGYDNRLYIRYNSLNDAGELKQFLAAQYAAGTPVIVIYALKTSTTESVAGQTLQVMDGDNVLEITQASLTGLELEAQYNTQVQLTVQEVESANLDNDVTVTIL